MGQTKCIFVVEFNEFFLLLFPFILVFYSRYSIQSSLRNEETPESESVAWAPKVPPPQGRKEAVWTERSLLLSNLSGWVFGSGHCEPASSGSLRVVCQHFATSRALNLRLTSLSPELPKASAILKPLTLEEPGLGCVLGQQPLARGPRGNLETLSSRTLE